MPPLRLKITTTPCKSPVGVPASPPGLTAAVAVGGWVGAAVVGTAVAAGGCVGTAVAGAAVARAAVASGGCVGAAGALVGPAPPVGAGVPPQPTSNTALRITTEIYRIILRTPSPAFRKAGSA